MKNLEFARKRACSRLAKTRKLLNLLAEDGIVKDVARPFLVSARVLVELASEKQEKKQGWEL